MRLLLGLALLINASASSCTPDVVPTAESECSPGERRCAGATPATCGSDLQWHDEAACSGDAPFCVNGSCGAEPSSCAALAERCGASNESCCVSPAVTGGQFLGGAEPSTYIAAVNDFRLDKFEVTVGRFRQFVAEYPQNKPRKDAGAHPLIAGSGWREAWNESLPETQDALVSSMKCTSDFETWTDEVGPRERVPINCVSWFVAFAFCAWDGGRLPTSAEWNYAAAGGPEQRSYAWGNEPAPSPMYAVYDCLADGSQAQDCAITDIPLVGSLPAGNGKFGQADLAGSMFEWVIDWFALYTTPCTNCANIDDPGADNARTAWGGDWSHKEDLLFSHSRVGYGVDSDYPNHPFHGFRCARDP
jgi:formylglycine-generating enzyme required for sulfatase activity